MLNFYVQLLQEGVYSHTRKSWSNDICNWKIKSSIIQKVINELKKKKEELIEDYLKFWNNFGSVLKEGLCESGFDHEKLLEICMFRSSIHNRLISLDEYISNFKEGQKTIYYLSGDNVDKLLASPQIEGFLNIRNRRTTFYWPGRQFLGK